MQSEDYKALKAMLEEFRKELEAVTAQTGREYRQIREADALILALTDVEPDDMKVFLPKKGKNYNGEKIEEICREREGCEERCKMLEERKAFLSRHIGTLEGVLCRWNVEDSGASESNRSARILTVSLGAEAGGEPNFERDECGMGETVGALSDEKGKLDSLTEREKEILYRVAEGMLNKEIAACLDINEQTVKNHISNIFQKLGVADRTQAAVFAIKNGLDGSL